MDKFDEKQDTIGRIVAAFAARPDVGSDEIVELFRKLNGDTAQQDTASPQAGAARPSQKPAIAIEDSVTEDKVYCLCCGRGFKMLKRHLGSEHGMTEAEYRRTFGLSESLPLVAPSYSRKKAAHAKQAGFGKYSRSVLAGEA